MPRTTPRRIDPEKLASVAGLPEREAGTTAWHSAFDLATVAGIEQGSGWRSLTLRVTRTKGISCGSGAGKWVPDIRRSPDNSSIITGDRPRLPLRSRPPRRPRTHPRLRLDRHHRLGQPVQLFRPLDHLPLLASSFVP